MADPADFAASIGAVPVPEEAQHADFAASIGAVPTDTQEPGLGVQIAKGLSEGFTHAVLPFAAKPEFYKGQHTGVELTAQILSDLATGRALAAGTGAALGALTPIPGGAAGGAMVGNVLYGLYAGVGEEMSRSRAEGQAFNPARAVVNTALEVNPLVKAATPLNAAIRVGLQAVGTVGKEYTYTGDAKQAAVAGAVSMVAAPFVYRGIRPDRLPAAATQKAVQDMLTSDVGLDLVVKAEDRLKAAGAKALQFDHATDVNKQFAEFYTGRQGDTAFEEFQKLLPKLSPEQLNSAKESWSRGQAFVEEASRVAQEQADKLAAGAYEGVGDVGGTLKAARMVGSAIDRRVGTNVEGLVDGFSKSKDRFVNKSAAFLTEGNRIATAQRKLDVSGEDVGRALAGQTRSPEVEAKLNTVVGKFSFVDEQGTETVKELTLRDAWRKAFEDVRSDTRRSGWDVGYVDNYIPRTALSGPDLALSLKDQITKLQGEALQTGAKSLLDLTSDEAVEFKALAAKLLQKPDDQLSPGDIAGLTKTVLDPTKARRGFSASSVFERATDDIPEWAREYDVGKLYTRYLNSNLKAAEFADSFRQGSNYVNMFRSMGLNDSAEFLEHYMNVMSGTESSKFGRMATNFSNKVGMLGRELEKSGTPSLGKAVRAVPDFMSFLNSNVYPAYLGLNVRATLRNMTQAWMTAAPELGGTWLGSWGQGQITKAALMTAKQLGTRGLGEVEKDLQSRGLLGNFIRNEVEMQRGFASTAQGVVHKFNDVAMWAYSKSDVLNRSIVANAADLVATGIERGDKNALAVLDRLPTGFKVRVRLDTQAGSGRQEALKNALADYLVGRTQFRYGKEQSFRLGQDLGQSFSMFTTWPVMTASDVADIFDRNVHKSGMLSGSMQAVQRVGTKYLIPLSLLEGVQHLVATDDSGEVPAGPARYLFGKDLRELSPLLALKSLDFAGGPAVSFGKDVVQAAVGGDTSKARVVLRRGVKTYIPAVSTVLNELDRLQEGFDPGAASPSREFVNKVTGADE